MGNCCRKKSRINKLLEDVSEEPSFEMYEEEKNNKSDLDDKKGQNSYRVIFLRCGKTEATSSKICSGWLDSPETHLTKEGINQAQDAGKLIKEAKFTVDIAYTSMLTRAEISCKSLLKEAGFTNVPIKKSWRLNEMNAGGLTGLTLEAAVKKFGKNVLYNLKTEYESKPPLLSNDHPFYDQLIDRRKYSDFATNVDTTEGESLKDCEERTVSYWENEIVPSMKEGRNVLIVSHDGTLRCLLKYWFNTPITKIMSLRLPNCVPCCIQFDSDMKPKNTIKFIGDASGVLSKMQSAQKDFLNSTALNKKQVDIPINMTKTKGGKHFEASFRSQKPGSKNRKSRMDLQNVASKKKVHLGTGTKKKSKLKKSKLKKSKLKSKKKTGGVIKLK